MQIDAIEDQLNELSIQVLCADRVTQMTKTYNDIDAVTRLLEEKERDLELAAKIGQTLLEKNKFFEDKNEHLEDLYTQANEQVNQLKHDLSMKDELLKIYTQNYEGSETSTPDGATVEGDGTVSFLQRKVKTLEDENIQLLTETSKLKAATDCLEEKEQKLVNDCVQQLEDVQQQLQQFARELSEKTEECMSQRDEITNLLHQIVSLQKSIRTLTAENMDLHKTLEAANDSQNYLAREIADLKEKNEELRALLAEAQDEIRKFRNKDRPRALRHNYLSTMHGFEGESLASELENSMRSEPDYARGYSPRDRRKNNWKIFDTAKAAKSAGNHSASGSASCSASVLGTSLMEVEESSKSVSQRSSMYFSDTESGLGESSTSDLDSFYGSSQCKFGRPGIPGSNDLQKALRRLSLRRANELNEMDYAHQLREKAEQEARARERTTSELTEHSDTESVTPSGRCPSPESMISGNSGYMSMTGSNTGYYKMPEKLRIVKPLEGSLTLGRWQRLATPHLGGIFEARPGVQVKGEKKVPDIEPEEYTLSDYEEDDDLMDYPTRFQESSSVYTFTDSRVRHPSEANSGVDSDSESVTTVTDEQLPGFSSSTPRMAAMSHTSHSDTAGGTSTFSMSLGLASILNERDLLTSQPEVNSGVRGQSSTSSTAGEHDQRFSTDDTGASVYSSNPVRFTSMISDTQYRPATQVSSPGMTLTLPTNSYNLIPSHSTGSRSDQGRGDGIGLANALGSQTGATTNSVHSSVPKLSDGRLLTENVLSEKVLASNVLTNDATSTTLTSTTADTRTTLGVINKLKNSGFSLYGYFSGGNKSGSSNDTTFSPSLARPNTLPIRIPKSGTSTTQSTNTTVVTTNMTPVASVAMATGESTSDAQVTAGGSIPEPGKRSHLAAILSRRTAGSVIGALTRYTKDGSF